MHFAFVSGLAGWPWGGSEELWSQAAIRLHRMGHQVAASVQGWPQTPPQIEALRREGIGIHERRMAETLGERARSRAARLLGRKLPDIKVRDIETFLLRSRPDLVCHSQGGFLDGLLGMEVCQRLNLAYACVCQANAESMWPSPEQGERLARAYAAARGCFFVSQANRELFEEQTARRLTNAELVRNPFKVPYDAHFAWPSAEGGFRLACVARLDPRAKGHDVLFRVLSMEKWRARAITVDFFGAGPFEAGLRALAALHKLEEKVRFCGHVPDVQEIWRDHHGLVLCSRFEGLPLAVVEAMLCGRPCIVTEVAGNAEAVVDGVTGFVAAAPVPRCLDEALERAWDRRFEWSEMGLKAQAAIRRMVPAEPAEVFAKRLLAIGQIAT